MKRMHKKREGIKDYACNICSRVLKKLKNERRVIMDYIMVLGKDGMLEVTHYYESTKARDLEDKTCMRKK